MDWRGYSLESFVWITKKDLVNLPDVVEQPEEIRLNVEIKRKPPTKHGHGQKGLIKNRCPLNVQHEPRNKNDSIEVVSIYEDT